MQKVVVKHEFEARIRHAATEKLSLNPAVNWFLFELGKDIWQGKERDKLSFSSAVPKIQWDSNPPLSLRLLGYGKPLPFIIC